MRFTIISICCVCLISGGPPPLGADKANNGEALIRSIVEEWRSRQDRVRTLSCTAGVGYFCPRGALSEPWLPNQDAEETRILPEEDKRFGPEPASWDIDFANQRVKKEYKITKPYFSEHALELAPEYAPSLV